MDALDEVDLPATAAAAAAAPGGPRFDMGPRVALATALYAAVYGRRANEGASGGAKLGIVWKAAGAELNWAYWVMRHGGQLPGVKLPREGGRDGRGYGHGR
ncbi:hypothetical protein GPECTOR_57g528 [Gonium pectorale]|uniref:Uncharacterized protein n=1 Tax=Gonium pectorale TaxID=33097 RepID=A0A150G5Z2_GONPE|nr:hypothetical protein GPECTOR_57g528 [Gonium pectorale]|eukprot:KXZ45238.1 hypothetical protein GPECTOR_57g528 [Gonium pectorale]